MKDRRKIGIIGVTALLSIIIIGIGVAHSRYPNPFITTILHSLLEISFFMLLYAVIFGVPAVILRLIFKKPAAKWIAVLATAVVVLCSLIMIMDIETTVFDEEEMVAHAEKLLDKHEWIALFVQYALTSSTPVLYCVACFGRIGPDIWVALVPSLMYFLNIFIYQMIADGFDILESFFSPFMVGALFQSAIFAVWALIYIFITLMIHKFLKNKNRIA